MRAAAPHQRSGRRTIVSSASVEQRQLSFTCKENKFTRKSGVPSREAVGVLGEAVRVCVYCLCVSHLTVLVRAGRNRPTQHQRAALRARRNCPRSCKPLGGCRAAFEPSGAPCPASSVEP
jgi:hypothetical protein